MATPITLTDLHDLLSAQTVIESPTNLKYWTVQDYHRMSELGILDPNERTELIAGQIILKAAKVTAHVVTLQLLANHIQAQLGTTALICTQDPIRLNNFSEPEPDLAIVKGTISHLAPIHKD